VRFDHPEGLVHTIAIGRAGLSRASVKNFGLAPAVARRMGCIALPLAVLIGRRATA
jgi:hypothetical protein